jgi:hypothetical protein
MWLACLWALARAQQSQQQQELNCTVQDGELPESQFGRNNFIIDNLDSFLFPFAIGQCTSGHLYQTNAWYMYQCQQDANNTWSVTKTQYNDEACTTPVIIVEQFFANNVTEGMRGYFDCNGIINTHLQLEFSLNPQCQNPVTVYGALGTCVNFVNTSSYIMQMNMICSDSKARMQIFNFMLNSTNATMTTIEPLFNATLPSINPTSISNQSQEMCVADSFCDKWMLSGACGLLTELPFGNNLTQLYARWIDCVALVEQTSTEFTLSTTELMSTELMSSTELTLPTNMISTAMSTGNVIQEESSAIRPSFLLDHITSTHGS